MHWFFWRFLGGFPCFSSFLVLGFFLNFRCLSRVLECFRYFLGFFGGFLCFFRLFKSFLAGAFVYLPLIPSSISFLGKDHFPVDEYLLVRKAAAG